VTATDAIADPLPTRLPPWPCFSYSSECTSNISRLSSILLTASQTRSGRSFAIWEPIPTDFSITDAVAAVAVTTHQHEDLAELDTGTPVSLLSAIPVAPAAQPITVTPAAQRTTPTPTTLKAKDKLRSKVKRSEARASIKASADPLRDPRPSRHQRHIRTASPPIKAQFQLRKTRIAATGFIGLRDGGGRTYRLTDFFGDKPKHKGFRLVKSSGRRVVLCSLFSTLSNIIFSSTSRPIVDSDGKVFAVYGGTPNDDGFMTNVHDAAVHALEEARASASLSYDRLHHRRGNFAQISGGDSHGSGQFHPGALVNGVINTAIFAALIAHPAFQRLAGFATGTCAAPPSLPSLKDFVQGCSPIGHRTSSTFTSTTCPSSTQSTIISLVPSTTASGRRARSISVHGRVLWAIEILQTWCSDGAL